MPPVTFTTARATAGSYGDFIQRLRDQLKSREEPKEFYGIPVMRDPATARDYDRFVLVELSNLEAESPVTLAVDVTNAYVVAYRTGTWSFFLREDKDKDKNKDKDKDKNNTDPPALSHLFRETEQYILPSSRRYDGLQNLANERREDIKLGMGPLDNAISLLRFSYKGPQKLTEQRQIDERLIAQRRIARSLIVVIQMVAEAARFKYIEHQVTERIPTTQVFCPTPTMLRYENCWKKLSKAIQQSNQGVFLNPVQVTDQHDQHGASRNVENINDVAIQDLAIMLFIPKSRPVREARICYAYTESANQNQTESHLPLIIVILIFLYAFGLDLKVVAILGLLLLILLK